MIGVTPRWAESAPETTSCAMPPRLWAKSALRVCWQDSATEGGMALWVVRVGKHGESGGAATVKGLGAGLRR